MVTEYDGYVEWPRRSTGCTPGDHEKRTALFTTGAEAVENAVKIARAYTGRPAVIVFDHAYHGRTSLTMAMTAKHVPYKHGFGPFAPEVYRVPIAVPVPRPAPGRRGRVRPLADVLRTQIGADTSRPSSSSRSRARAASSCRRRASCRGWPSSRREHGIVFVADEIQSGLARTGSMFACEHEGVVPDLVLTAKALGGGLPLSAVTGRAEIMDAAHPGGLGGTYAGNPVACAAALGALEAIEERDLAGRARGIGERVLPRLRSLAAAVPAIGDVRGRGAMLAIEFVEPGGTTPAPAAAAEVARYCHDARRAGADLRHVRQRDPAAAAAGDRLRSAGRGG